ncbi:putative U3 small nucleolar ribonucleoprotein LCP5 [Paratrimastix pyriformis]|uniref:U3 small nucleolar ribonucleoprotein LCP5 n=1 Tax=Paratrimastix pyriformis TaxID=342808 RepID=A0ABQ8UT00_9EUKA|nr:putative U3 small nucleolar ribonucleoprotein LCP5 [Paratrimastix pyriformis]
MNEEGQVCALLGDINSKIAPMIEKVRALTISAEKTKTDKGFSFLDVKNDIMLDYLTDLVYYLNLKVQGADMTQHEDLFLSLAENRTYIEKIRTLDQKFKYQIDKLIKTATAGVTQGSYQQYRPHPEEIISSLKEAEEEDGALDEETGEVLYKAPHMRATEMEDESEKKATGAGGELLHAGEGVG